MNLVTLSNLKLFRRHESTCTENYAKEFRVYQWMLEKQKGKKATVDCNCTIYAEGTLVKNGAKHYLRPKSTDKRLWAEAEKVKASWLTWGSTTKPANAPEPEAEAGTLVTIQAAAKAFLEKKETQKNTGEISSSRYEAVKSFVNLRFIPFATVTKGLSFINEMDKGPVWTDFLNSWVCLDEPTKKVSLGTTRWNIAMLREFITFCVWKEWLSDDYASKEYGIQKTLIVKPKEPFSEAELEYIYRAAREIHNGVGCMVNSGLQRAKELLLFIWVLRYTGLRISDVVRLEVHQLRKFDHGRYTHAIWCNPKKTLKSKTQNFVHIPIPGERSPNHPNLANALSALAQTPKQGRFFFKAGTGLLKTACQCWRDRVNQVFDRAEELMVADGLQVFGAKSDTPEHPTPHKFRHTFAATLLQGGAGVRLVAQYLGDTETTVRLHYSKFCAEEQEQAAEKLGEAQDKYDAQMAAAKTSPLKLVG